MKTPSPRRTRIDDNQLLKMRQDGMTHLEIAVAYGVSTNTVSAHLKRLGAAGLMIDGKPRTPIPAPSAAPEQPDEPRREDGGNRRPHHLENYHRARRGFHVPAHKQDRYFALLTAGVPIAEAARQLGLSGGDRAS